MLKIKEDKMQELENVGFVENGYFSNFVYETTIKKGDGIIITVDAETREVEGTEFVNCYISILSDEQIKHHCPELFANDMVEKDGK